MVPEESDSAINKVVSRVTLAIRSINCGHAVVQFKKTITCVQSSDQLRNNTHHVRAFTKYLSRQPLEIYTPKPE